MRTMAASSPSNTLLAISCTSSPAASIAPSSAASTPVALACRTVSRQAAGVARSRVMLTTLGTSRPAANSPTMRTASAAIACCACSVDAPMWAVPMTPGSAASSEENSPADAAGSSGHTSSATRNCLATTASRSAAASTISERDVLTKDAPGRIASKNARPMKPRVCSLRARCTLTTSAAAATSSGEPSRITPSSAAAASVRLRDQATTRMPNACARLTNSVAMLPRPTTPRVRP